MAYCLNQLGNVAHAMGDAAAAEVHYRASYALREQMDDPEGMAVALNHLGEIARLQGRTDEAEQLYRRSLAIFEDIGDPGGLVTGLAGLGGTLSASGEHESAAKFLWSALELATTNHLVPHTFAALVDAGELLLRTGQPEQGLAVLAVTLAHATSGRETQARARFVLRQYRPELTAEQLGVLVSQARQKDVEGIVARTRAELVPTARPPAPRELVADETDEKELPRQTELEALSERELEVLRLVAAGLPNQQIADRLIVSVGTVKSHLHNIIGKLGAGNRTQAVHRARELRLL
jgi:ATP/maltotriose-dependent transcriptional regulator MalT